VSLMHTDLVIPNNTVVTGALDVTDQVVVAVHVPAGFDGTTLTITACDVVGGTYLPVVDASGSALELTAAASQIIAIAPDGTRGLRYMKLTSDVNQTPAITLKVATLPDDRA
jgi:hypothetical protein